MELFVPIVLMVIMGIIPVLTFVDFFSLLFSGERVFRGLKNVMPLIMLAPIAVLFSDLGEKNDCCGESAMFSPEHRLSPTVMILICLAAFFYSAYRKRLAPPLMEVIVNCFLVIGVVMDIIVGLQLREGECWYFGIIPVAGQFLLVLTENHFMALNCLSDSEAPAENYCINLCRRIVFSPAWQKIPLLILLCLPLLIVLVAVLLVFGQRPDSFVRAFTDTYKHGFSQLDYQCAGVVCGGHFLCTIAAKGNPGIVKPLRIGVRAGRLIQCNRQLLVSNAFEELLEQRVPWLHRPVRRLYNKIGDFVHRYYGAFDHAWVSDAIYILMKPLEWMFVLVLYMADRNPENRIAQQYLHREHRQELMRRSETVRSN
jgi:hypothetical protein